MLDDICAELRNYFCKDEDKIIGNFSVINGMLVPSVDLQEGQCYRIIGSVFNDGVHKSDDVLIDEQPFHGGVWKMRVPADVLELDRDVEKWLDDNRAVIQSPYTSESFGGYSYTKSTNGQASGVDNLTWQSAFASKLAKYRRIRL